MNYSIGANKPKPEWVKKNKSMYGKRIKQLEHIIKDDSYIPKGSTNGYHDFIFSMHRALVTGRKITPKMESSITNIVKKYTEHFNKEKDPEYRNEKLRYINTTLEKLTVIKNNLKEAKYSRSYTSNSLYFLNSIETQVKSRGKLTIKQRKALNSMNLQFKKRIKNNEKKA